MPSRSSVPVVTVARRGGRSPGWWSPFPGAVSAPGPGPGRRPHPGRCQREVDGVGALVLVAHAERATVELRELVHGIMPEVLTSGGLRAGVDALLLLMPFPVERAVEIGRLAA